ncbi:UNVERIFIED_ORG: hypothetical protein CLV66_101446 [Actinomadura viridilutea]
MVTGDELAPEELRGISSPWCLTDATVRMIVAREQDTTTASVEQALDVLERCRRRAAAHPRPLDMTARVEQSALLAGMGEAWAEWLRPLETAMPTLDDIRVSNVAALVRRAEVEVSPQVKAVFPEEGVVAVPRNRPSLDVLVELTRVWAEDLWPTLTRQVSGWLSERLRLGGSEDHRRRYFALLAAVVPDLGDYGDALVTHLELTGSMETAAYLLCIERHPRTAEAARRSAAACLRRLEQAAHPHGDDLPEEIWDRRGRRLSGVRTGFVRQHDGPPEEQMLELSFEDGTALQIWAGYEGRLRLEEGPHTPGSGESHSEVEGFTEAQLLTDDVEWYFHDIGDDPRVADAIGRTLTDFRAFKGDDDREGLVLQFETVMVRLQTVDDLVFEMTWGDAASGWMEE